MDNDLGRVGDADQALENQATQARLGPSGFDPSRSHTPGPWRWEVNHKSKCMNLCGGARPKFDLTVMDAVRWGMGGAAFRFIDNRNIMHRADELTIPVAGREHHVSWFQTIDHPDARLIAAAPDLLAEVEWYADQFCEGWCEGYPEWAGFEDCGGCRARRAAAKARGLPHASAIEARRAETGTGSVHESAAPQGDAQSPSPLSGVGPTVERDG